MLVEMEGDFDLHAAIYRLAAGANGGAHLPILHLRYGLFFQAETGPFENLRVEYAPVGSNRHVEQHGSLILGLASFVGVLGLRAVDTDWGADAVYAGAEHAAARAAAFAGAKSSAGATADTGAIAISERISDALGQRIAEVGHIGTRDFQVRRAEQGRVHRQLGIQILDLYLRRGELRDRKSTRLN